MINEIEESQSKVAKGVSVWFKPMIEQETDE